MRELTELTGTLTNHENIDTTLCMKGSIRTKEKCPRCGEKFTEKPHLHCPPCQTVPKRYFIDVYQKGFGRLKVYSDKMGYPLDSYLRATRVLEAIRYEIDQHIFDPTKYVAADLIDFRFETRVEAWYQSKLREVEKGNLAASYVRSLHCYIHNYYLPFFKGMDVRDMRSYHIQQFYEKAPNGKSLKYLKNIMDALQNFLNTLVTFEYVQTNFVFPVITLDRIAPKWIDFESQIKILKVIPEEDRLLFTALSFQGTRPGEGIALKVMDFNFTNGTVAVCRTVSDRKLKERVKGKVTNQRLVSPVLLPILKELCAKKFPGDFVFINPRTGGPYSYDVIRKIWNVARKKVGTDISLYEATRHSVASIAVNAGVSLKAIQDVLGHTDIRTTLKYAHANVESQRAVFQNQVFTLFPDAVSPDCPQEKKAV